ncbi:MAG: hypothetical protein JRJ84_18510 [Deltaproteobacteria bacterium]|nr:hypothetical protein [Deltaproteobacteria bacterium]
MGLVEALDHRDDPVVLVAQRHADQGTGAVAAVLVPALVEAGVPVGVLEQDAITGLGDPSGDPLPDAEVDLLHLVALHHLGPQLVAFPVDDVQGGAVRIHQGGDLLHHHLEQRVDVQGGPDGAGDSHHRFELTLVFRALLLSFRTHAQSMDRRSGKSQARHAERRPSARAMA